MGEVGWMAIPAVISSVGDPDSNNRRKYFIDRRPCEIL